MVSRFQFNGSISWIRNGITPQPTKHWLRATLGRSVLVSNYYMLVPVLTGPSSISSRERHDVAFNDNRRITVPLGISITLTAFRMEHGLTGMVLYRKVPSVRT